VFLDPTNEVISLNKTPTVSAQTDFQFALQFEYNSTVDQKDFYITVLP